MPQYFGDFMAYKSIACLALSAPSQSEQANFLTGFAHGGVVDRGGTMQG